MTNAAVLAVMLTRPEPSRLRPRPEASRPRHSRDRSRDRDWSRDHYDPQVLVNFCKET